MAAKLSCPCIDPGKLRHRVDLVRPVKARDELGHENETWVKVATVWAAIEPAATQDVWQAMQVQTTVSHRITLRYRAGVTGEMVFRFRGRTFNIVGEPLNPEELNVLLVCLCDEAH